MINPDTVPTYQKCLSCLPFVGQFIAYKWKIDDPNCRDHNFTLIKCQITSTLITFGIMSAILLASALLSFLTVPLFLTLAIITLNFLAAAIGYSYAAYHLKNQ